MNNYKFFTFLLLIILISSTPVSAYIGPGMAGGVIAAVLGVIASIFLALFGIVYYPIKRAIKNLKSKKDAEELDSD